MITKKKTSKKSKYHFLLSYAPDDGFKRIRRSFEEGSSRFISRTVFAYNHEEAGNKLLNIIDDIQSNYGIDTLTLDYEVYVDNTLFQVRDIFNEDICDLI